MEKKSSGRKLNSIETFKEEIAERYCSYLKTSGKDQVWLAKKIKLNASLLSKILRKNLEEFTIDRLLRHLRPMYPDLVPVLKKAKKLNKEKAKKP